MKYATMCSGIEAPFVAWDPLGWEPVFFSEIEAFPSAVLKYHYPDVPNLGDMEKIDGKQYTGMVDLVCAGTPCQSFSVAGLRKGMEDPRGNLTLTYLRLIEEIKPKWVIWENVPGIISDKTKVLEIFLDTLESLGYIIDIDILDSQHFGVPQRRRRVFVCAQSVESFLKKTTISSALTIAQCLVEILHGILIGQYKQLEKEQAVSKSQTLSEDGVLRKMKLFGLHTEKNNYKKLQKHLIEALGKYHPDAEKSESTDGLSEKEHIAADKLKDLKTEHRYSLTEKSLKNALGEAFKVMKSCITLTGINKITETQIYTCSMTVLAIGKLIVQLNRSAPPSWTAESSFLTAIKEYINYARENNNTLFSELERIYTWNDFLREAEYINKVVGYLGDWRPPAAVLFEREGLQRDPAPCRETREETSEAAGGGIEIAKPLRAQSGHTHREDSDNIVCMAHGATNAEIREDDGAPSLTCIHEAPIITQIQGVRRLSPIECEFLQGFPRNYTNIPYGRPKYSDQRCPDGHRYKALGNSMAVPVVRWLGNRIQQIEEIINE